MAKYFALPSASAAAAAAYLALLSSTVDETGAATTGAGAGAETGAVTTGAATGIGADAGAETDGADVDGLGFNFESKLVASATKPLIIFKTTAMIPFKPLLIVGGIDIVAAFKVARGDCAV